MQTDSSGKIITFYSYKGGTGRSMTLANVAWILAGSGKKVLVIDWDLEAPGLHRYFHPFLIDKDLTSSEGLIDFVTDFAVEAATPRGEDVGADWYKDYANILFYATSLDWEFPGEGTVDFIPAGRQGASYSTRVNSFNWQHFYDRLGGGVFLESVKEIIKSEYDYILIDSRTGVSDTSGVCTVQLPDMLVVCFTLNNQSIEGASAVAESVYRQRKESGIRIFPVPTRLENAEKSKLDARMEYAQHVFARFPNHNTDEEWRRAYWAGVGSIYIPFYAYEEILAPFGDSSNAPLTLVSSAEWLAACLTDNEVTRLNPESVRDRSRILAQYAERSLALKSSDAEKSRAAERAFKNLVFAERETARQLFTRMVRLGQAEDGSQDTRSQVTLASLDPQERELAQWLCDARILASEINEEPGEEAMMLADETLIRDWARLREWIDKDREFLFWRQSLQSPIQEWARDHDERALLRGRQTAEARRWFSTRKDDLNQLERKYILAGIALDEREVINTAEKVFSGFTPERQEAARRALLRMVSLSWAEAAGDFAQTIDTRAQVSFTDLDLLARETVEEMALAGFVLTGNDDDTAERVAVLAHESLVEGWERLRDWVREDRAFLLWRQNLRASLDVWKRSWREESALLRGDKLDEAEGWLSEREGDLSRAEVEYIKASLDVRDREWVRNAERAFSLLTPQEQQIARRALTRMVRLSRSGEHNEDEQLRLSAGDFDAAALQVLKTLRDAQLVIFERDRETGNESARLAHDSLLRRWTRLRDWIREDREFMLLRQELQARLNEWERDRGNEEALLRGPELGQAEVWLQERETDLSTAEREYIRASLALQDREQIKIEKLVSGLAPDKQEAARRALTRMVRLDGIDENGKDAISSARLIDIDITALEVVRELAEARVVVIERDDATKQETASLVQESLIKKWERLRRWIEEDRQFLFWRQQLGASVAIWENSGGNKSKLLEGASLATAKRWLDARGDYLSGSEKAYIGESLRRERAQLWRNRAAAAALIVLMAGFTVYQVLSSIRVSNTDRDIIRVAELNANGRVSSGKGDFEAAINSFTEAIKLKSDFAESYINRGNAYIETGDYDKALEDFTRVISIEPTADAYKIELTAEAYKRRGYVHVIRENNNEAMEDYNQALALNPGSWESYYYRGQLFLEDKNFDRGIADFDKCIQIKPDFAESYYNRGRAFEMKGDSDRAIADYSEAIKIKDDYPEAYFALAGIYDQRKDKQTAIDNFQKAVLFANDKDLREAAENNLRRLGGRDPNPPEAASSKVLIHYNDRKDQSVVENLVARLKRRKFDVPRRPDRNDGKTTGDVRYFYVEDRPNAVYVKEIVEYTLGLSDIKINIQLIPVSGQSNSIRPGIIEVWLPSLPKRPQRSPAFSPVQQTQGNISEEVGATRRNIKAPPGKQ